MDPQHRVTESRKVFNAHTHASTHTHVHKCLYKYMPSHAYPHTHMIWSMSKDTEVS